MIPRSIYDFGDTRLRLDDPKDRELLTFILSQALYGEATGVYCGKSLYAARSLEAARFYLKQARQELNHLELFAEIFRLLELRPMPAHWVIRLLSAHNNYYPLKVLMEHALGEGMVLDIFRDVLLQVLPDDDPRVPDIKKKLLVVCREEEEHISWGRRKPSIFLSNLPGCAGPTTGLWSGRCSWRRGRPTPLPPGQAGIRSSRNCLRSWGVCRKSSGPRGRLWALCQRSVRGCRCGYLR